MRPALIAIAALTLGLALVGCTSDPQPSVVPTRGSSPGPSDAGVSPPANPTPTPSPADDAAVLTPPSRIPFTCDDAIPRAELLNSLAAPVKTADPTAIFTSGNGAVPATYHIRTLGGLDCAWWDGTSFEAQGGGGPVYATVAVVPLPASDWAYYLRYNVQIGDSHRSCSGDTLTKSNCYLDAYIHEYWVEVVLHGMKARPVTEHSRAALPSANAMFDPIVAKVTALGPPTAAWTPPSDTLALPQRCGSVITPAELSAALKSPTPLSFGDLGPPASLRGSAVIHTGGAGCTFETRSSDAYYGYLNWLRGGAWAAAEDAQLHPSTPLRIPGLEAGDSASTRHNKSGSMVTADLVIGGNWFEFTLFDKGTALPRPGATRGAAATQILTEMVARLR